MRHLVTILLCVAGILGGFYAWHLSLLSGHAPAHVNSIGGIRHLGPHWSQMLTAAADHPGDEVPMSKVDGMVCFLDRGSSGPEGWQATDTDEHQWSPSVAR